MLSLQKTGNYDGFITRKDHSQMNVKEKTIFESIYQFAKSQDEEALKAFLENTGASVQIHQGDYVPVLLLAKEGNHKAVKFLIEKFHANRSDALFGYAWGGYVREVDQLIEAGCFENIAVEGYARGNHVAQVNRLIEAGARRKDAAWGFARGGNIEQANLHIAAGASRDSAIYGYARGGYIEQVNQLIAEGANPGYAIVGYAESGNVEQVEHLIAAGWDRDGAVWGYALGGFTELVNEQIMLGCSRNKAAEAYALSGRVEQVNQLLAAGASRKRVVEGYARAGCIKEVNQQLAIGVSKNNAVLGYGADGNYNQVNELIAAGADRSSAVEGYAFGGYLKINQETVLRLAAYTDDATLRKLLIQEAKKKLKDIEIDLLFEQATRLNKIMDHYHLSFNQAKGLSIKGSREWLLQGTQLVRNGSLAADIYFQIASLLMNLSLRDTKKVFSVINRKLFFDSMEHNFSKFKSSFFSASRCETFREAQEEAKKRYEKRRRY